MKKIVLFLMLLFPFNVWALEMPDIHSQYAIVYDLTSNEEIMEKNSLEVISIASLTKIMTVLTALENCDDLDKDVVITSSMLRGIYWNASVAGLKAGDVVTFRDLLYATILPSGADAAQVLAYATTGDVATFVGKMNELAISLGLSNTHFMNTIGLDNKEHYSTAKDVLIILMQALKNETFREVYTTREYTLKNGLVVNSTLDLYNKYMNLDLSRILGSKTGNTSNAGLCMSSLIKKDNHELLLITLKGDRINNDYYNVLDTLTLIDYLDLNYEIPVEVSKMEEQTLVEEDKTTINFNFRKEYIYVILVVLVFIILNKKSIY